MNTSHPVQSFSVTGMSCEGCVNAVKRLVLKQDSAAQVEVDLQSASAKIISDKPAARFEEALTNAGYPTKAQ